MHGESKWPVSTPRHPMVKGYQVRQSWKKVGRYALLGMVPGAVCAVALSIWGKRR
jgi:hypothetical protein